MSCKNITDTWYERGKDHSRVPFNSKHAYKPVRNALKVKGFQVRNINHEELYDLNDLNCLSSSKYLITYKQNRFKDWNWFGGPIHRLIEKYVDNHIKQLHKKCMSYDKKYRHKVWERITWEVHMLNDGSYNSTSVYESDYYVDETGILRKGNYTYKDISTNINLQHVPYKQGEFLYYLQKGKNYFIEVNGKKIKEIWVQDKTGWFPKYSSYSRKVFISGWYILIKKEEVIQHKVLTLNKKGGPMFGVDGPLYSIKEEVKVQYVLKHVWWNRALQHKVPIH